MIRNTILLLLIIFTSSKAYAIDFEGKFRQGHFIIGKTEPKSKIWIDKKPVKVSSDGFFVFGIDRDRKYDVVITKMNEGKKEKIVKKIQKREYKIQRIDGLPEKKVTPPKEFYDRIKRENKIISNARLINSNLTFFKNKGFKIEDYPVTYNLYKNLISLPLYNGLTHDELDYICKTVLSAYSSTVKYFDEEI